MRLAFLFALLLVAGCDAAGSNTAGSYAVMFENASVSEFTQATLAFDRPAEGETTVGTYRHIGGRRLATTETLRATGLADGRVSVELDPDVADGGVGLVGPFSDGVSEGTWVLGSIAGPMPGGTFRAERL